MSGPRRTGIANLPLHHGKDGIPYTVDRKTCDQSIELLSRAINRTKLELSEKHQAFSRLNRMRMG